LFGKLEIWKFSKIVGVGTPKVVGGSGVEPTTSRLFKNPNFLPPTTLMARELFIQHFFR